MTPGYIYLRIHGDFDVDRFTASVPLRPDEAANKDSFNPERRLPRCSYVSYGTAESTGTYVDVYKLSEDLVDLLSPHAGHLAAAMKEHQAEATLQMVLYVPTDEETPMAALGFSTRVIQFLNSINASIDVDSYLE
ncbi:DUF4279 domain-containing protein [Luteolibacter sp. SL250]|uniref:DUF4279 domain-containing protein n=1 Tax=Luteolibacter sp. SL250 TaxID=2995170 RepID=UPI00226F83D2|nr:DUF4279 domain-containing protein [Luteolibacter sp. SL250]WAC21306.1 DUF4279 domain-containing protein [Luteolibacter sp. SL250]